MTTREPVILYIGGYGRSGSTILDVLLGSHPSIFGAGEITRIFEAITADKHCSCGLPLSGCLFWRQVLADAGLEDSGEIDAFERATRTMEAAGVPGSRGSELKATYVDVWQRLLRSIARHSQASVIVDSSKTTRHTRHRPAALTLTGLPLTLVQLTRDPSSVIASSLRGTNQALARGSAHGAGVLTPFRVALNWASANRGRYAGIRPSLHVRYEDLIAEPETPLRAILAEVNLDVDPILTYTGGDEVLPAGHGIAGNRFRQQGEIHFRRGDARVDPALPIGARLARAMVGPTARRLGYGRET